MKVVPWAAIFLLLVAAWAYPVFFWFWPQGESNFEVKPPEKAVAYADALYAGDIDAMMDQVDTLGLDSAYIRLFLQEIADQWASECDGPPELLLVQPFADGTLQTLFTAPAYVGTGVNHPFECFLRVATGETGLVQGHYLDVGVNNLR